MNTEQEFKALRKALSEGGSNFDYIFMVLQSLNEGMRKAMDENSDCELEYIEEKQKSLRSACEMIIWDTNWWMNKHNKGRHNFGDEIKAE